jgi:hypothetical protein
MDPPRMLAAMARGVAPCWPNCPAARGDRVLNTPKGA